MNTAGSHCLCCGHHRKKAHYPEKQWADGFSQGIGSSVQVSRETNVALDKTMAEALGMVVNCQGFVGG